MPKNPFFHIKDSESRLIEDLSIELIQIHGDEWTYIARETFNRDYLFGEDTNSKFKDSATIEMYLKNYEGHNGSEVFSKFGIELKNRITLVVSKRRFEESVAAMFDYIKRPREGDLLYSPIHNEVYEIEFVDNEVPFFQGSRNYTYELSAQTYTYSQETLETGIPAIDAIQTDNQDLLTYITLSGVSGSFLINEEVYYGLTLAGATFSGTVTSWSSLSPTSMYLKSLVGTVAGVVGSVIKGSESLAQATVVADTGNTAAYIAVNAYQTNEEIRREARTIIDFSEVDPFSEGGY